MGVLQARILEWVAISFSRDLPDPGIEPRSPALQVDSLPTEPLAKPRVRLAQTNTLKLLMYLVDGFILLPMSLTSKTQIL